MTTIIAAAIFTVSFGALLTLIAILSFFENREDLLCRSLPSVKSSDCTHGTQD